MNTRFYSIFFHITVVAMVCGMLVGCITDCGDPLDGPLLVVSPNPRELMFDSNEVNKSQKKSLQIHSGNIPGRWDITVTKLKIENNDDNAFSIVSAPKIPFTLKNGEADKKEITVQFLPKQAKTFYGLLCITWDSALGGTVEKNIRYDIVLSTGSFKVRQRP